MKKLLVAAGAVVALIGVQTAVSATYDPLDRAGLSAAPEAGGAAAARATAIPYPARDAGYAPVSSDLVSGGAGVTSASWITSEENDITPGSGRVEDRVATGTGRYNLALSANSQAESCQKQGKLVPNKVKEPGDPFQVFCNNRNKFGPGALGIAIPVFALGVAAVVADDGESD